MAKKTLNYRIVNWSGKPKNLEKLLWAAHSQLQTTTDRTFIYSDGKIQGVDSDHDHSGMYCHIAYEIDGLEAETVTKPGRRAKGAVGLTASPVGTDFSEGAGFFLVKNNHLVFVNNKLHESAIHTYIGEMLLKAGSTGTPSEYSLEPVADLDRLEMIKTEGVRSIEIDVAAFAADLDYVERRSKSLELSSQVLDTLEDFFGVERFKDIKSLREMENLTIRLALSYDKRIKKGLELAESLFEIGAQRIIRDVGENEGYTIVTNKGNSVRSDQIRIHSRVDLTPYGNSILQTSAWSALRDYMKELVNSGVIH